MNEKNNFEGPTSKDFGFKITKAVFSRESNVSTIKFSEGFVDFIVQVPENGEPILRQWPGAEQPSIERKSALFSQAAAIDKRLRKEAAGYQ